MKPRPSPAITLAPLVLLLAGCAGNPYVQSAVTTRTGEPAGEAGPPTARAYACDDGGRVFVLATAEAARVDLGERVVRLERRPTKRGTGYGDDALGVGLEDGRLTIDAAEGGRRQCSDAGPAGPWVDAALRGVRVRALGHGPDWSVEIVPDHWLHLRVPEAGESVLAFDPVRAVGIDGTRRYTARSGTLELRVRILEASCTDGVSGETMPLRVSVTLGDRTLDGCGRRLEPASGPPTAGG
jgi:uncharacterized membrane protein